MKNCKWLSVLVVALVLTACVEKDEGQQIATENQSTETTNLTISSSIKAATPQEQELNRIKGIGTSPSDGF